MKRLSEVPARRRRKHEIKRSRKDGPGSWHELGGAAAPPYARRNAGPMRRTEADGWRATRRARPPRLTARGGSGRRRRRRGCEGDALCDHGTGTGATARRASSRRSGRIGCACCGIENRSETDVVAAARRRPRLAGGVRLEYPISRRPAGSDATREREILWPKGGDVGADEPTPRRARSFHENGIAGRERQRAFSIRAASRSARAPRFRSRRGN